MIELVTTLPIDITKNAYVKLTNIKTIKKIHCTPLLVIFQEQISSNSEC